MNHGWTSERKKRQAEAIRKWEPWKQSTGPKTEEGRKTSSMNAFKHGMRSAEHREVERLIAQLGRLEREMREDVSSL